MVLVPDEFHQNLERLRYLLTDRALCPAGFLIQDPGVAAVIARLAA